MNLLKVRNIEPFKNFIYCCQYYSFNLSKINKLRCYGLDYSSANKITKIDKCIVFAKIIEIVNYESSFQMHCYCCCCNVYCNISV